MRSMIRAGVALLFAAAVFGSAAHAQPPRYLRARSDLHVAHRLLVDAREPPNVARHLSRAAREVEAAIREVERAAIADGRNLGIHPPVDTRVDRRARFSRIMALLRSARADIGRAEENPRSRGWRNAALRHIDSAMDSVRVAARELRIDRELRD